MTDMKCLSLSKGTHSMSTIAVAVLAHAGFQAPPCQIFDGKSGTGTSLSSSTYSCPLSLSFLQCFLLIFIHLLLTPYNIGNWHNH